MLIVSSLWSYCIGECGKYGLYRMPVKLNKETPLYHTLQGSSCVPLYSIMVSRGSRLSIRCSAIGRSQFVGTTER